MRGWLPFVTTQGLKKWKMFIFCYFCSHFVYTFFTISSHFHPLPLTFPLFSSQNHFTISSKLFTFCLHLKVIHILYIVIHIYSCTYPHSYMSYPHTDTCLLWYHFYILVSYFYTWKTVHFAQKIHIQFVHFAQSWISIHLCIKYAWNIHFLLSLKDENTWISYISDTFTSWILYTLFIF